MWSRLQSRKETVQWRMEGELAREVGVMLNSVWGILFLPSRLLPGSCHSDLDYYLHLEGSQCGIIGKMVFPVLQQGNTATPSVMSSQRKLNLHNGCISWT